MDAPSCNALPDLRGGQGILEQLERENLFVTSLDPDRRWYRYHHLFREFLLGKLRRENQELLTRLHQRAGDYYELQGELEAAFSHFIHAEAPLAAARVLSVFAPKFVEQGRVDVLHRYLNALPEETLRASPALLIERGDVLRRMGQAGTAATSYEDGRTVYEEMDDAQGICRALTRLSELYRAQGNYRQAQGIAETALTYSSEQDPAGRANVLMALAKSVGFLTGMDAGRALAEQALTETRRAGSQISHLAQANLLQSLGQICWWHGDPQATVHYCQEALHLAGEATTPLAARACIMMATPYLYWRDFKTALQYAERGLEIAQTLHLNEILPGAYTMLGNVLTRLGETARAESTLRQAMDMANQLGLASYERVMAIGYLAYNLYGQGRVDEARQLAEGALWAYPADTYEIFVCRSVLADIVLERGHLEQAETL
ncbi:MAG: hypothetical protein HC806_09750, partial [Anaerolineae bacterium]|nr:hypothetical protein [Anaerolineae bacterium]